MTSKSVKRDAIHAKRETLTHAPVGLSYGAVNASSGDAFKSIYWTS